MGDLSDYERRQIVDVLLAGASVTKSATLIGVSRATVFLGYVSIHESWEDNISEKERWVKINIDRKRSSCIEDGFEKSYNYCSTGNRTAELNMHLEDPVSTKSVQRERHNPTSTVGLQLLNL
jgi:hypothetical protein